MTLYHARLIHPHRTKSSPYGSVIASCWKAWLNVLPRPHVLWLLLSPDQLSIWIARELGGHKVIGERRNLHNIMIIKKNIVLWPVCTFMYVSADLFNPDESDLIGQSSILALLGQLIVDLPGAEDQPLDLWPSRTFTVTDSTLEISAWKKKKNKILIIHMYACI